MTPTHPVTSPNLGGRTGDLDGNLNRVKRELRRIRFPVDFDAGAAREGDPMALLPALHYALLGFSRHVTSSLIDAGHDLQAKSDARFVENAWRALREAFGYNPALSPSQFLSPGFAERKLMLLHDAVELCKRRHNEHARRKRAEETAAAVNREGVPRVARAVAEKRGAEAREGRDAETAGRNRARFSASSVGRAPSAFAITRHAGGVPGGEAHTDTGGRARGEDHASAPGAHRERWVPSPGSDAGSDFEFSRPSLGGDVSRAARPRAPLDEVDAPVEPWFARSSRSSKRGEATGGTTAVATDASRDTATSAPATEPETGAPTDAWNPNWRRRARGAGVAARLTWKPRRWRRGLVATTARRMMCRTTGRLCTGRRRQETPSVTKTQTGRGSRAREAARTRRRALRDEHTYSVKVEIQSHRQ